MLNKPKISVIMSIYNGEKYLKAAIESILAQTFTNFEFIIVNDGSTDSSLEIIQSYNDERIKIINNEKNIGLTKSLNKTLKVARGEFIARQDADDVSLPNRFKGQMKYFEEHPEVALLGTSIYKIDEKGGIVGKGIALAKPGIKDLFKGNQFNHGSVMFKKDVANDLGGYNELFGYVQDYELWLRIAKYYKVGNLTKILYKLRSHNENVGFTNREESALYHLLALRLTRDDLDEEVLKTVKDNGIKRLYPYLSKTEAIHVHIVMAYMYMHNNNIKMARRGYKKVFNLNPFNLKNDLDIVLSYLGKGAWLKTYRIYEILKNSLLHLKNLL